MSDLTAMYARLRGTLTDEQTHTTETALCPHPRRLHRYVRTEEDTRTGRLTITVVTTEIHCDGCHQIIGRETHRKANRR